MININEFILGKEFQAAIAKNKVIDAKAAKIRKESWRLIRQIEPKIEELGKKIERLKNDVKLLELWEYLKKRKIKHEK